MKARTPQVLVIFLAAVSTLTVDAATVSRVTARGDDGKTYYVVACSDGNKASVVVEDAPRNVCIYADHLGRSCRADWSVDNAAAYACRTAPPRGPVP